MKYRVDHLGNFNSRTTGGVSYYNHHQRSTNGGHPQQQQSQQRQKSNTTYVQGGDGQGQIELVDKILSQISEHQSSKGNKLRNGVSSGDNGGRARSSYVKKNQSQQYSSSSYQGRLKSNKLNINPADNASSVHLALKEQPCVDVLLTGGREAGQCSKCEYVFVDGQLLPKYECTHKAPTKESASPSAAPTSSPSPRARSQAQSSSGKRATKVSTSKQANMNRQRECTDSSANTTNSAHESREAEGRSVSRPAQSGSRWRNKKATANQSGASAPQNGSTPRTLSVTGGMASGASGTRQSIIPKRKSEDMKKFMEAQLVFGQNIIDVVPVQGAEGGGAAVAGLCAIQLLTAVSAVSKKSEPAQLKLILPALEAAKPIETAQPEPPPPLPLVPLKPVPEPSRLGHLQVELEDSVPFELLPPPSSIPLVTAPIQSVPSKCEGRPNSNLSTSNSGQAQAVKKIRCLIANFITIQVEDEPSEDSAHSEESCVSTVPQEDILKKVDLEKLGFQNFDGKNIGLYKNIGYINRNKAKFVHPTEELLQRMLTSKMLPQEEQSASGGGDNELERNLSSFYDLQSPASYEKEYAYSVLEALINDDGQLTSQIKARKYRYPDYEYSSDGEELHAGHERFKTKTKSKSKSKSSNSTGASSLSDKSVHFHWLESDIDQVDSSRSSGNQCKFTMTRYIKNSALYGGAARSVVAFDEKRSLSATDPISEEASSTSEDHYGSYYITEVSFSAN